MRPTTREQVAAWVELFTGFRLHATVRCSTQDADAGTPHASQLDYVSDAFLGVYSSAVVMAARNAGKSYAAAILCLLDAWHKPKVKIAVCAFIRQQADYIYTYLVDFLATFKSRIGRSHWKVTKDAIEFANGSEIRFFSGGKSQANVKGFHPDVLVVDECDQFTAEMFDGIANCLEASSEHRRFDCLSTNYKVSGDGVVLRQIKKYEEWNKGLLPGMKRYSQKLWTAAPAQAACFLSPSTNTTPSIRSLSFSLPFSFRQPDWAFSASLNAMANAARREPGPLVR